MLNALIRTKLASFAKMFHGKDGKVSKGKVILYIIILLYAFGCFTAALGMVFKSLFPIATTVNLTWLCFSLYLIMAFSLMLIESVFTTKSQIFEAKDNDMLLAMPIKPWQIIVSRLSVIYVIDFVSEMIIFLPLLFGVLINHVKVPFAGWLVLGISAFVFPLFVIAVGCIFGGLLAVITKRMRNKAIMTTVFSVIAFGAYMFYFPKLMELDFSKLVKFEDIFHKIPFVYWFGNGVANGDILHGAVSLAIFAAAFGIALFVINKLFFKMVADKTAPAKIVYKERTTKLSSTMTALVKREFSHLLSSSIYMMNACLLSVLGIIAAAALLIFKDKYIQPIGMLTSQLPSGFLPGAIIAASCLVASMVFYTAPSISIEGKTLWLLKTLPVSARDVLRAKLRVHCILSMPPAIIFATVASIIFKEFDVLPYAITGAVASSLIIGVTGLFADMRFTILEWESETIPVKQGISVLITLCVSLIPAAIFVVYAFIAYKYNYSFDKFNEIYPVVLFVAALLSYRLLLSQSEKKFANVG